jgi:hypothetical protein
MPLFKSQDRSGFDKENDLYLLNPWKYISDSNEPSACTCRAILQSWYDHITILKFKTEVKKMISSQDYVGWYSAIVELLVHEISVLHNYQVVYHHFGTAKKLDFVFSSPGLQFAVEVTHKNPPSISLEELKSHGFVLQVGDSNEYARAIAWKLRQKHSSLYNLSDMPYIIALENHLSGSNLMNFAVALFGKIKIIMQNCEESQKLISCNPERYYFDGNGYYFQRDKYGESKDDNLAGVLAFNSINLMDSSQSECCFFPNPFSPYRNLKVFDKIVRVEPNSNMEISCSRGNSIMPELPGTKLNEIL